MADDARRRSQLPAFVRKFPADLAVVVVLANLMLIAVMVPGIRESPLRLVLGFPFLLFLPGYALVAALFPEDGKGIAAEVGGDDDETVFSSLTTRGIDGLERVVLSFGLSIALTPLVGIALNFTPWSILVVPVVLPMAALTIATAAVAAARRRTLPPGDRFRVPYRSWYGSLKAGLLEPETQTDFALNALLIVTFLVAMSSVGYALAVPDEDETFTEFYLLNEAEDGDLVAADYPANFTRGEPRPLVVGVSNREHQQIKYTVVGEFQDVTFSGPNETRVRVDDETEVVRYQTTLRHNQTHRETVSLRPSMSGERLRLQLLLFRGDAPANPTAERAYRKAHLWVTVSA